MEERSFAATALAVWGAVKSSDTNEKELIEALRTQGHTVAKIMRVLKSLKDTGSVVEVRPGVLRRWRAP